MPNTPSRVANRLASGLKQFQPVLDSAKARDVNESDTVIIITDMLSQMFGYDKYSELTSELSIRGTYCDVATTIDGEVQFLIETKAIGAELKDAHTRQAVEYAGSAGVDWVVLTNGIVWKIYKVIFGKPIEPELVIEFDLLNMDAKSEEHIACLYLLTKEGFRRSALGDYDAQREALSRYCIAALLVCDPVLNVIRKELRRMSPDVRIDNDQVKSVLQRDVIKRDAIEGEKAIEAHRRVLRAIAKGARAKAPAVEEIPAFTEQDTSTPTAEPTDDQQTKQLAAKA